MEMNLERMENAWSASGKLAGKQGKDDGLNFHRFGGRRVCNQKGASPALVTTLPKAKACTLQRGVLRHA